MKVWCLQPTGREHNRPGVEAWPVVFTIVWNSYYSEAGLKKQAWNSTFTPWKNKVTRISLLWSASAEGIKRFINDMSFARSIPHPDVFHWTHVWTCEHQMCQTKNWSTLRSGQRTWLKLEPTWWSPAGELRWAEYHFMNVPLELFSLSCINLCSLPALVERGDAFMFRRSSDLRSTAALFTPSTSSPTVSHWTTRVLCECVIVSGVCLEHRHKKPFRFQQSANVWHLRFYI